MTASYRISVGLLVALAGCTSARLARDTTSPCLTGGAEAAQLTHAVQMQLSASDSASLGELGLPVGTVWSDVPITLVTDPARCAAAVRSLNAELGIPDGSPHRIRRAYVLAVGRSAYASVDETSVNAGLAVYYLLDARFRWIAGVMALR